MKFVIAYSATPERTENHARALISLTRKRVVELTADQGGADAVLESLVIADEGYFAKEVTAADPIGSPLEDEHFFTAGHTVIIPNSQPATRLFIRIEMIEDMLKAGEPLPAGGPGRLGFFVLAHEIGHALDNRNRPNREISRSPETEANWLRGWRTGMSSLIHSEIAAQKFAAAVSTAAFFEEQRASFFENSKSLDQRIRGAKTDYQKAHLRDGQFANIASTAVWRMLEQFAKLRVLQSRLPPADQGPMIRLPALGTPADFACAVLSRLTDQVVQSYPNHIERLPQRLEEVWRMVAQLYGMIFAEKEHRFEVSVL